MQVKSKVSHTQPETHLYREEGEVFELDGKLYKHVEPVKQSKGKNEDATEDERPLVVKK